MLTDSDTRFYSVAQAGLKLSAYDSPALGLQPEATVSYSGVGGGGDSNVKLQFYSRRFCLTHKHKLSISDHWARPGIYKQKSLMADKQPRPLPHQVG